ncbi:MAG TPA: TVP38/TMEM64 family protein [Rhodospirillales bacterium]|nr:TVP38/TMEM64 family protein [Rhodospirillales bacterium]
MLSRGKIIAAITIVALLVGVYGVLSWTGVLATITDGAALQDAIVRLGLLGPLAVIGLIAVAIILSPIPSAPIALAAGAAYGHVWGTLYIAIGSETGALIAFIIARLVGYDVLRKWFGERLSLGLLGSQNTLMAIVFATRLMPFISFDIVSYAAGLTPLSMWRFAVATLAGIAPASFLLAHFGDEMASMDSSRVMIAILALGALTLAPVAVKLLLDQRRSRKRKRIADGKP